MMNEQSSNELMTIDKETALEAFTSEDGLEQYIDNAKLIVSSFKHDLSTDAGRKRTASLAHRVSKLKVKLDDFGKDLVSGWKSQAKVVDDTRKSMRDDLDKLRDEARQPLTDWQDAEEARKESHKAAIDRINDLASPDYSDGRNRDLSTLSDNLIALQEINPDSTFEEFELEARKAKEQALPKLQKLIDDEKARIAKDEELKRLRREAAEQKQRDHEEKIKREAAETARLKAEAAAKEVADKVEREKQEAIQKQEAAEQLLKDAEEAGATALKQVLADALEDARLDDEKQAKLEANNQHVGKIRKAAKVSLMNFVFVDEKLADKIVEAIHNREISNISINY